MILTELEQGLIKQINNCVEEISKRQKELLQRGRVERTFTSRLATSIENTFNEEYISVDPFYNKHGDDVKYLKDKVIELDIAVHESGGDDHNLVAIELETNNSPEYDDMWKIEELTNRDGEYAYLLGLFVVFGVKNRAGEILHTQWYKNANPVDV